MGNEDTLQWFAMRATYGRNLMAQEALNTNSIGTFIPMRKDKVRVHGRMRLRNVPVIRDLIFVRTCRDVIREQKKGIPYLQYIMSSDTDIRRPIIVPDVQMDKFIAVCGTQDEQLVWLKPEEFDFRKGDKVRVTGGVFEGQEGILMRLPGKRSKSVVVAIQGVIAVAMTSVHPSLIEKL